MDVHYNNLQAELTLILYKNEDEIKMAMKCVSGEEARMGLLTVFCFHIKSD